MDTATTEASSSNEGHNKASPPRARFSRYQIFVVAILAFLQFTIILDFMIVSPLGAIVMPTLHINPQQFGFAVSSYAFSAALSGVLAAGFADRFDRKRLLLFFYAGFVLGTLFCALAQTYPMLLMARVVTGLFGGMIGRGEHMANIAGRIFKSGDEAQRSGLAASGGAEEREELAAREAQRNAVDGVVRGIVLRNVAKL